MKNVIILFIFFTMSLNAQSLLKFDKRSVQCEDKWVATQMEKDSTYTFGFIYIDSQAGLTLNYEGKFKIDKKGNFNRLEDELDSKLGFMKIRLQPNRVLFAEIPESKFKELKIEETPSWLATYKTDENTIERLYRWGYMYNGWDECSKALTFLEKAEKINPKFKGLQTELAFSYNALEKYDKAETALKKALEYNPNDCYTYKELAYTYTKQVKLEKVSDVYNTMSEICKENKFIQETAYNLAYEYFKIKDKAKFKKWKIETEKWSKSENLYTKNLNLMETELNK